MRRLSLALVMVLAAAGAAHAGEWGIGFRTAAQTIAAEGGEDNALHLSGGGIQVRWRWSPRWSLELTAEGLVHESEGGAYTRRMDPGTLAIRYHLTPYRRWDWYLLFGVGGTHTEVTYRKADGQTMVVETAEEAHAHFGAGLERRWRRLGLGAELRFVGLSRDDEQLDEGVAPSSVIPADESGAQLNLALTYYF